MADSCDHDLPRQAAGLPSDWQARLAHTRSAIAELGQPTELEGRRALARAYRDFIALLVAQAALELRAGAPEAEAAFEALEAVRAGDDDAELRRAACESLFQLGQARRTRPGDIAAKTAHQLSAVDAALALASRSPALDDVIVAAMTYVVRAGQFHTVTEIRERAFATGRAVIDRFLSSSDPRVAANVVRAADELTKMMQLDDPEAFAIYERLWTRYASDVTALQRVGAQAYLQRAQRLRVRQATLALACCERIESLAASDDAEIQRCVADARALRAR